MKTQYKFIHRKGRNIQVCFADDPSRWFSTGTQRMSEAVLFAEEWLRHNVHTDDIMLNEFAVGFFTKADPRGYRHRLERRGEVREDVFFDQHQARLDMYIMPAFGRRYMRTIRDTQIEDWLIDLRGRNEKLANSTKNKILACFRLVLKEAQRQGYIDTNPADAVRELPPNYATRDVFSESEMNELFPDDDERLIRNFGSLMWATYFSVMKDTGFRPSEVSGLSRFSYYPELHGVYTEQSVDWKTSNLKNRIKTTGRGQRFKIGFLSPQTERLLQRRLQEITNDHPFQLRADRFIYSDLANDILDSSCRRAGVDRRGRTQYSLRHTFNTQKIGTIPEQARLLLMGHRHNREEYDHITPKDLLRRAQRLIED